MFVTGLPQCDTALLEPMVYEEVCLIKYYHRPDLEAMPSKHVRLAKLLPILKQKCYTYLLTSKKNPKRL